MFVCIHIYIVLYLVGRDAATLRLSEYIYIYAYTYIHTHTHIHINIYIHT